ncbi:MAG: hypothetical protein GX259_09820 [Bacteroidales bacterium]|nr:hypothetical protein [Bacteroidales bacterium]
MKKIVLFSILITSAFLLNVKAQDNVGIGTTSPHATAALDITATNKGLLIPRIALSSTTIAAPVTTPATGLLVYNTATAGTAPNNVVPGFYYWDGTKWVQVGAGSAAPSCVKLDEAYDCGGAGAGRTITADAGAVEITMPASATNTSALGVYSSKGTLTDPTALIEAGHSGIGGAILTENSNVNNPFNVIQSTIFSDYNATGDDIGPGAVAGFYEGKGNGIGIYGQVSSTSTKGRAGVLGINLRKEQATVGVEGRGNVGVYGRNNTAIAGYGVGGITTLGDGVHGETADPANYGVCGVNNATTSGVGTIGNGFNGVLGQSTGVGGYGIWGNALNTNGRGVYGIGYYGVYGESTHPDDNQKWGVYTMQHLGAEGVIMAGMDLASLGTKSFVIEHPKQKDKLIKHYCIEAPRAINMYRGNVVLDGNGEAIVQLPDYFELINANYSYHLTPIGAYANLYIKEKIKDGKFKIAGGSANMEVSWTVYADRNDDYMKKNRNTQTDVIDKNSYPFLDNISTKNNFSKSSQQEPAKVLQLMDTETSNNNESVREIEFKK